MFRVGIWLALGAMLVVTRPARAQDAADVVEPTAPAEYSSLIDSALEEFGAGRWAEARALFSRAQAMYPNARALRGVGMAAYELRDYVEAYRALEGALVATRRPLSAEQRTQVEALRARAENFVGRFVLEPAAVGATLSVDGRVVALGASILLAIGEHELILSEPSRASRRASVSVRGGEADVAIVFSGDATVAATPPTPEAVTALDTPRTQPVPGERADQSGGSAWPYVLLGVGSAVTIAGAIILGVGISDYSTVSRATMGSSEWADLEGAYARAPTLQWTGGALLGVGLAAVTTGIAWALGQGRAGTDDSETWVAFGPTSVTVGGKF